MPVTYYALNFDTSSAACIRLYGSTRSAALFERISCFGKSSFSYLFQPSSRTNTTGGRCGGLPSRGARIFQKQKLPSWKNIDAAERWTVKTESTRCNKRSYVDELQHFFEDSLSAWEKPMFAGKYSFSSLQHFLTLQDSHSFCTAPNATFAWNIERIVSTIVDSHLPNSLNTFQVLPKVGRMFLKRLFTIDEFESQNKLWQHLAKTWPTSCQKNYCIDTVFAT